jgi:hypothetical protein
MRPGPPLPRGVYELSRGTVSVTGPALEWLERLDAAVVGAASSWGAHNWAFPPVMDAAHLARMDYFRSFPHLMTVPVSLPPDDAAAERFTRRYADDRPLPLQEHAPVEHVLAPAACYHVYPALACSRLEAVALVTTRSTCFRRESEFQPLRRQWTFSMRELVCVGTADEVDTFLEQGEALVVALCQLLQLPYRRKVAADPFFQPTARGRSLYQRLDPVKHEYVIGGLPIASSNRHHQHFADAFGISRDGRVAHSGCVAFGLERWLGVACERWGPEPDCWPEPGEAGIGHG